MPMDPKDACKLYEEAKTLRGPRENDWKMASAYCLPQEYAAWQSGKPPLPADTTAVRRFAYDNTGANALPKYISICQRLVTPDGQRWHKLSTSNAELMKVYNVRQYFDELSDKLFTYRYNPYAGFVQATGEIYQGIGVYGNGPVRVGWRKEAYNIGAGFAYKAIPMRDFFVLMDDNGRLYSTWVRYWLTAPMFKRKFPNDTPPRSIELELQKGDRASNVEYFEFVHIVYPRDNYDQYALDQRRYTHCSLHLCVKDQQYVGKEGGYAGNPYLMPRASTSAGNDYGSSPAIQALPALGSASATKKTVLKQGQKAVDPSWLANDDGVLSGKLDTRPGKVNYGGVDSQGRRLVYPMETGGNFQVAKEILTDERADINDSFFVTLFQLLIQKEMTATEAMEMIAERASLLAPTMGRLQVDWLGPDIDREIAMLVEYMPHDLPEMPPELVEAKGEYKVEYTSPLAKHIHAEEDAGFTRVWQMALEQAQATGNPDVMDHFDMDIAIPEIADHMSVPTRWMASPDALKAKRDNRARQQQTDQLVKAGPALASVANAAAKTGGGSPFLKGAM